MAPLTAQKTFRIAVLCSVAVAGFAVILLTDAFPRKNRIVPEKTLRSDTELQAVREVEDILQQDSSGGKTPEESLALFLDALRAGDVDDASKYFISSRQEEWRANLHRIKDAGLLENLVKDLSAAEPDLKTETRARFYMETRDKNGDRVSSPISLERNARTKKWKITGL